MSRRTWLKGVAKRQRARGLAFQIGEGIRYQQRWALAKNGTSNLISMCLRKDHEKKMSELNRVFSCWAAESAR